MHITKYHGIIILSSNHSISSQTNKTQRIIRSCFSLLIIFLLNCICNIAFAYSFSSSKNLRHWIWISHTLLTWVILLWYCSSFTVKVQDEHHRLGDWLIKPSSQIDDLLNSVCEKITRWHSICCILLSQAGDFFMLDEARFNLQTKCK